MYEQYFGLGVKPFQLTPDPDFFFGSRGHSRARAFLEYGLLQKEGFIVVTGEVGAGKTTLVRGVLRSTERSQIVAAQIVTTQLDADDLLRMAARAFGLDLPGVDKAAVLGRLEAYFRSLHAERRRALLIIDEAQNLSARAVEELRMLSNFQIGTDALLQSFLVGQPEFRLMMQRPEMQQLKQRVIASYHLRPLESDETRDYIEHRLRHAGWVGNPRIDDPVFDIVHDQTGGVPRRINTLCDRLLLDCYLSKRNSVSEDDARQVVTEFIDEFGARQAEPALNAAPAASNLQEDCAAAPAYVVPPGGFGMIQDTDPDRLPNRFERLDSRICKLEANQELLQGMVRKLVRVLPSIGLGEGPTTVGASERRPASGSHE